MDHIPPPPYSVTDLYSTSDARSVAHPHSAGAPTSSNASNVDHTSIAGRPVSEHDAASSTGDPIYTPPYTPDGSSHANAVGDGFDLTSLSASAAAASAYFDSRPVHRLSTDTLLIHNIAITAHTQPTDLPFPEPEKKWLERDLLPQDWETFVNYVIPHHTDVSNYDLADRKLEAELVDESMSRLNLGDDRTSRTDFDRVDAQLEPLRHSHTDHVKSSDVSAMIQAWNEGFFGPRGLLIELLEIEAEEGDNEIHMPGSWKNDEVDPTTESQTEAPRGPFGRGFGRGWMRAENGGFQLGKNLMSADNSGFRLGRNGLVADNNGFRIGNLLVADSQGFKFGPIRADNHGFRIGGGGRPPCGPQEHHRGFHPEHHPVHMPPHHRGRPWGREPWSREPWGRGMGAGRRQRTRSHSSSSSSSSSSASSVESVGSLPDYDHLREAQLPVAKQAIKDWLSHPEQPITKDTVRQITQEIKAAKRGNKCFTDEDKSALRQEVKDMFKEFKAAKKAQKYAKRTEKRERRAMRREAKRSRKAARRELKQAEREARQAAKRAGKMRETIPTTHTPPSASPIEAGTQHHPGFMRAGDWPGRRMHPMGPPLMNGRGWPFTDMFQPPNAAIAPELQAEEARQRAQAQASSARERAEETRKQAQANAAMARERAQSNAVLARQRVEEYRGRAEANASIARMKAEASRLKVEANRIQADVSRMRTQAGKLDDKARRKLLDVAEKLEEEAGKLKREGERLMAEALQLGVDLTTEFHAEVSAPAELSSESLAAQETGVIHN